GGAAPLPRAARRVYGAEARRDSKGAPDHGDGKDQPACAAREGVRMTLAAALSLDVLRLDPQAEAVRIEQSIRDTARTRLRRRGIVVGLSGGIDSSVVAALAARAVGADRVLGLIMPEGESSPDSARLARTLGDALRIETIVEDITASLDAAGCYRRRDE